MLDHIRAMRCPGTAPAVRGSGVGNDDNDIKNGKNGGDRRRVDDLINDEGNDHDNGESVQAYYDVGKRASCSFLTAEIAKLAATSGKGRRRLAACPTFLEASHDDLKNQGAGLEDGVNYVEVSCEANLRRIGGILMKLKLLVGFVQCLSFIPTTLRMIPWPDAFTNLSRILNLASIDFFSAFGNLCAFSTGYLQKFVAQMVVLPFAMGISGAAYLVAAIMLPRLCANAARQTTRESLRTRLFELNFLVVYTLYTSVSTSIFRLFDCQEVQGTWYLSADFTVRCFEAEWNAYAAIAVVGIAVYTIGIPLVLFVLLRRNRAHLYADGCPEDELSHHAIVQKKLGAVYKDYEPHSYYFDLVDLLRRLLLTGGLIVLGDASNVQIFLGGMVCACWLCLVIWRRPYGALWDNVLSAVLSFQLMIIILSGMALEIYRLTPSYAQDRTSRLRLVRLWWWPASL